jgi:T5SS/PEP-CTERM-associated repeat protein
VSALPIECITLAGLYMLSNAYLLRRTFSPVVFQFLTCLALYVMGGAALANIEITGNAFPLVNTPGNFAAAAPGVVVGINGNPPGSGNLIVNAGSVLTSPVGTVGELFNGVGNASIQGTFGFGGGWNISGPLNVGLAGQGVVSVIGNNAVSATAVILGAESGAGGTLSVSGTNPLTSPGGLVIGDAGGGQFMVNSGGNPTTLSLPFVNIGDETSGNGTATMQTGTTWTITGHLGVGVRGTGTLNLNGNAALNTPGLPSR